MSQSPLAAEGSKSYADAWRAINILIRSDGTWSGRERNLCFRNRGDGTFEDISYTSGLDLDADGRAFVTLDLDADGDQDLLVKNRNGVQLRAFRNDLAPDGARHLAVRLSGRRSNRDGVGARVWLDTSHRTLMREIVSGSGYLSQRSREARFGLPADERVERVRVRWPLGLLQEVEAPPQQGGLVLVEGEEGFRTPPLPVERGPTEEPPAPPEPHREPGTWLADPLPAPEFSLRQAGQPGTEVRLSDHRGGAVVLNFWATWCPPCRKELRGFQQRLEEISRLATVLAVSVDDPETEPAVRQLAESEGLAFSVLLADSQTAEAYSVLNERLFDRRRALAIPTTFLIDAAGRIRKVYRGEVQADALLRDLSAGQGQALPFSGRWVEQAPARDLRELASAFAERGLTSAARAVFDEALARGDRSPQLLNNLAGTMIAEGDAARAERLLREALEADPRQADAMVNLAGLLVQRGETAEASNLLERAVAAQPGDAQALSALGNVRFLAGRLADAEDLFRRAVESAPDDARMRENLGAALASQGRLEDALQEYRSAASLGAQGVSLHSNLGVLLMRTGRVTEALESFSKAVQAGPEDPGARLNLAQYWLQAGDIGRALAAIEQAQRLAPGSPAPLLLRARALALSGRREEALEAAGEALRRFPESVEAAELVEALR